MQDNKILLPLQLSEMLQRASARDLAALYLGYWELLRALQKQQKSTRRPGLGTLIGMAGLQLSNLTDQLLTLATLDSGKAESIAQHLAHSQSLAVREMSARLSASDQPRS